MEGECGMESKKLKALLTAVELGSFTKAAEVLGYTQSGLTHMMNSLEKEVGFTLLERGRGGVMLTEDGERVAPAIREFLQANARLDSMIEQVAASHSDVIRVSAYASMAVHWLPRIIQRFREQNPAINVDIRMADHVDEPYSLLEERKMDIIFVSRQEEGDYEWLHLADDRMYAVLPANYPVGERTSFPLQEFDGKEFIMPTQGYDKDIMRILNRVGVKPNVLPTMVDDPTAISLVGHGLGISMMAELTLRSRTDEVRLLPVEPTASRELGIALRRGEVENPAIKAFVACTQQVVSEIN